MAIYQSVLYLTIYIYIIIMPLIYSKFRFMGIPFNGDVWFVLITILYLIGIIFSKDIRMNFLNGIKKFFTDYLSLSIFALIVVMAISYTYANYKMESIKETGRFISYIMLYFIIIAEGRKKKFLKGILLCFILVSVIVGVLGILDYAEGIGIVQTGEDITRVRVSSTLENSNNLGAYFILIIFPVIMLAIKEAEKKKKLFYMVSTVIFLLNIIFSFSRNSWIGLAVGLIIFALMYSLKFLFAIIPLAGVSFFIPQISDRLKEITDVSQNLSRVKIWNVAIMIIRDHPIGGVGSGNFYSASIRYMNQRPGLKTSNFIPKHPHNIFLQMQSEMGIFGTVIFVSIIVSIIIKLRYFIKNVKDKFYSAFYKGFFVSFIVFLLINLVDDFFSAPKVIVFFWIIIAVLQSYDLKSDNNDNITEIKTLL